MTYYGAKELADSFRLVRKNTLIIAEEIPEQKYSYRAAPDLHSVGVPGSRHLAQNRQDDLALMPRRGPGDGHHACPAAPRQGRPAG